MKSIFSYYFVYYYAHCMNYHFFLKRFVAKIIILLLVAAYFHFLLLCAYDNKLHSNDWITRQSYLCVYKTIIIIVSYCPRTTGQNAIFVFSFISSVFDTHIFLLFLSVGGFHTIWGNNSSFGTIWMSRYGVICFILYYN